MELDPYDPCPCGSGLKLKFCCKDLASEMGRVLELQENSQSRMALNLLDDLAGRHPKSAWVRATRAGIEYDLQDLVAARGTLEELLADQPDHPFAITLLATVRLTGEGYEDARPVISRAFRECVAEQPAMLANLALGIAAWMRLAGRPLAARRHLVLALQLAPLAEQQETIFYRLVEFDGSDDVAFPFRSVYDLIESGFEESLAGEVAEAVGLATAGCWRDAAERFDSLAGRQPDSVAACVNAGLCRAWDGDGPAAGDWLHRAARLETDEDTAEEWETLAQLLDLAQREDGLKPCIGRYRVGSFSALLTQLDEHSELIVRVDRDPENDEDPVPVRLFHLLDRPLVPAEAAGELTLDTVPQVVAQLTVRDADVESEEPGMAVLAGREGEELDRATERFVEIAGAEVELLSDEDVGNEAGQFPREFADLAVTWHFAPRTSVAIKRSLHQQHVERFVTQTWPATPLAVFGDRAPGDVAGDPDSRVALRGALRVLETVCEQYGLAADLAGLRDRLQVPAPATLEIEDTAALHSMSTLGLLRLVPSSLTDDQLAAVLNRALLIRHSGLMEGVLVEFVDRPELGGAEDFDRCCVLMAELCQSRYEPDQALAWIARGRDAARGDDKEFERSLRFEMQELQLRLVDSDDPAIPELLARLWNTYGSKIPELREQLLALVTQLGLPAPWEAAGGDAGTTTESGLWTPSSSSSSSAADPGEEKKIWLPGQD